MTLVERQFVGQTLRWLFNNEGEQTAARLALFQAAAPDIVDQGWLPLPEPPQSRVDPMAMEDAILKALSLDVHNPFKQTCHVLEAIGRIECKAGNSLNPVTTEQVIDRLSEQTKLKVLAAFRGCVRNLRYVKRRNGRDVTSIRPLFAVPFLVLRARNEVFPVSKVSEFAACFAYTISTPHELSHWDTFLNELRERDVGAWRDTLLKLISLGSEEARNTLRLLGAERDDAFVDDLRAQLITGQLPAIWFEDVVDYWLRCRPPDCHTVLYSCYTSLKSETSNPPQSVRDGVDDDSYRRELAGPSPWFVALVALMVDGYERAWEDFEIHLKRNEIPMEFNFEILKPIASTLQQSRLRIAADWLKSSMLAIGADGRLSDLGWSLLNFIVEVGGFAAIHELRRVRTELSEAGKTILNATILRVEDRLVGEPPPWPSPGKLLDFINRPQFGMIRDERDLYETVCQAIEQIQSELQDRAEGVAGFWNGNDPKTEADCQNVLWPRLRDKLLRLGVAGVEERYVGPNRADFWVELPQASQDPLNVALELKTARKSSGRAWLVDSVENQLWDKYLRPTHCRHGIHVILWFRDRNRHDAPSRWKTAKALLKEVRQACDRLERDNGVSLAAYVVDVTSPHRSR